MKNTINLQPLFEFNEKRKLLNKIKIKQTKILK